MTSPCAAALAPKILAQSVAQTTGMPGLVQTCPASGVALPDGPIKRAIDDKLICEIMCCCAATPGLGAAGQKLKQSCASAALDAADAGLDHRSRFKAEVSYDMTTDPPRPLMHRDASGFDTTAKSGYWLKRAQDEIDDFARGQGQVRRPDVVIVRDPCLPPTQNNIERVIEMKFGNDASDVEQNRAYDRIAGKQENYEIFRVGGTRDDGERGCDCSDGKTEPLPQLVPAPKLAPQREESTMKYPLVKLVGYGALTAAAGVLTGLAMISIYDGIAGDAVGITATGAAAARTAAAWRALMGAPLTAP